MNIDLDNSIINNAKNNSFIEGFRKELQNFLEKSIQSNNRKENLSLENSVYDDNKFITDYRDKMYVERLHILNNYAKQTEDKGKMFFIYDKNSKLQSVYNIFACEEGKSRDVIELSTENLPKEAEIGSVLRKIKEGFVIDNVATKEVTEQINKMKDELYKEQNEYLKNNRVEGHVYEVSEKSNDRAWIFDITTNADEAIEEIGIERELLQKLQEGDKIIYRDGIYQIY